MTEKQYIKCPECESTNRVHCEHISDAVMSWQHAYENETERDVAVSVLLGRALSDKYGIHTLAELDKRLAPDPQVSDDVKLAFAGLTDLIAARDYLDTLISAQRGEVEG